MCLYDEDSLLLQHTHTHTPTPEEGGGLLDRLKKTLSRSKDYDEPDSSFVTFGQLLSDCPVSPENKVKVVEVLYLELPHL